MILVVNDHNHVYFTNDIHDIDKIITDYKMIRSEVIITSNVNINLPNFKNFNCTKISNKNFNIWVFPISEPIKPDMDSLSKKLQSYILFSKIIINNEEFTGKVQYNASNLVIGNDTFSIKDSLTDDSFIHIAMTKLNHDNGRMLDPISTRFTSLLKLMKAKASLLTGYIDLMEYFKYIKQPVPKPKGIVHTVKFDKNAKIFYNVSDNKLSCEIIGVKFTDNSIRPYVLYTLKPIKLSNQKFPFQVIKKHGINLFLTPVILNNEQLLKDIRGGINLLK